MARSHSTKKGDPAASVIKLKDRNRGHVWLTVRDGRVVGATGSEPRRFMGLTRDQARHIARHGGAGRRAHAVVRQAGNIEIGDIVQRADAVGKNRYVVVDIRQPWVFAQRISGSGGPGITTFPSPQLLRKVG